MIVWGGFNGSSDLNTGGRYNPGTDSWTATSTTSAPAGRAYHPAVWTGSETIVSGGCDGRSSSNTARGYSPGTLRRTPTPPTTAPPARTLPPTPAPTAHT